MINSTVRCLKFDHKSLFGLVVLLLVAQAWGHVGGIECIFQPCKIHEPNAHKRCVNYDQ